MSQAHPAPDRVPCRGAFAWRADELREDRDWIVELDGRQRRELLEAVRHARHSGKPIEQLAPADFPLYGLAPAIAEWKRAVVEGRGLVLLRGLPVEGLDLDDAQRLLLGLGRHMGSLASQNAAGDVVGHVRDVGADADDPAVRLYKTSVPLRFHTDGADLTALLCLRPAAAGGTSRIASSTAVYNELLRRRPDLVPRLFAPFYFDRNDEQAPGEPAFYGLPILRDQQGRVAMFYIGWYIDGAQRHAEAPRLGADEREAMRLIEEIAGSEEFCLEMDFRPGDLQLVSNRCILHARTGYRDADEPEKKRHLLRLWLALPAEQEESLSVIRGGIPARDGVAKDREGLEAD